jgi:hypothetical protein
MEVKDGRIPPGPQGKYQASDDLLAGCGKMDFRDLASLQSQ